MAHRRWIHWFLAASFVSALPGVSFGQNADADRKARVMALSKKIDQFIAAKQKEANVTPAGPAEPAAFFRRLSLDLTGKIPDFAAVRDYIDFRKQTPDEDNWDWVDRYINGYVFSNGKNEYKAFPKHFAAVFRSIMLGDNIQQQFQFLAPQYEAWLRERLEKDVGYDKIVHELITQNANQANMYNQGAASSAGAFYFVNENKPENLAAAVTRVFLGVKLECAQCHKHPFAEWTRDQFWEFAAFFAGTPQAFRQPGQVQPAALNIREIKIPGTNKTAKAKFIDGKEPAWKEKDAPRNVLADWITSPSNAYFAKATVDHVWSYFFGVSLLEPILEASDDSPNTHPELLDELASQFAAENFDLKFLVQAIVLTDAYGRASTGKEKASKDDYNLFVSMPVRGMTPEQIFDSVAEATFFEDSTPSPNMRFNPFGQPNTPRAQFLTRFTSQDRKHETQTSILQALYLMNGEFMAERIDPAKNEKLDHLIKSKMESPAEKVHVLYKIVLSRLPSEKETNRLVRYIDGAQDPARAYTDIYWSLLNSSEFILNH
ncbi:MAG: DUF1553 domain-containing protein [Planctomycetes bacterium]|nr:DUF1553 domain-containing protein [Planctomycetota bacterium]